MNQPSADSKGLHGNQILQHSRRIARLRTAPRPIVNKQRIYRHQTFLLIDHQRAARADMLHVRERLAGNLLFTGHHAELELTAALLRVRVRKLRTGHHATAGRRIVDRPITVFMPHAIVGERRDLAVIALQCVKVRIGRTQQDFARLPLCRRNIVHQRGPRRCRQRHSGVVDTTCPKLLDFENLAAIDLQPDGDEIVPALNFYARLQGHLALDRVGGDQIETGWFDL